MLSHRLIRTAVAFFVAGVALGIVMGVLQDFRLSHVHPHLNLLGWVALGLVGLLYAVYPALARGWLAHAHYWLHTLGLVIFMGAFAWAVLAGRAYGAGVPIGAFMVAAGVLLFAINVYTRLGAAASR